jgi:hypothetical protein
MPNFLHNKPVDASQPFDPFLWKLAAEGLLLQLSGKSKRKE